MKNASLNLSVNAIVVFVLAFAMLGVGLMFTNMIRSKMTNTMGSLTTVEDFEKPPTAQEPLRLNDELKVGQNEEKKLEIGFYNKEGTAAKNVKVGIKSCLDETGSPMNTGVPLGVSPMASSVEPGGTQGFKFRLDMEIKADGNDMPAGIYSPGTYTCTFIAYDAGSSGTLAPTEVQSDEVYEKKQFWLEVTG